MSIVPKIITELAESVSDIPYNVPANTYKDYKELSRRNNPHRAYIQDKYKRKLKIRKKIAKKSRIKNRKKNK